MARQESDREDLLRDATAFVQRIQFAAPGSPDHPAGQIFVGFRRDGSASFYFDSQPVYHFNADSELRRAFWNDQLVKAHQGRLIAMRRVREDGAVHLLSRQLSDSEQSELLQGLGMRFQEMAVQLQSGQLSIVGQVPETVPLAARVAAWLADAKSWNVARRAST